MVLVSHHQNSQAISHFIEVLNCGNAQTRLVRYYGVAEILVRVFTNRFNTNIEAKGDIKLTFIKLIDAVCELTILDRTVFTSCCNKVLDFHLDKEKDDNLALTISNSESVLDILGVSKLFSTNEYYAINKEFNEYKRAMIATYKASKDLFNMVFPQD